MRRVEVSIKSDDLKRIADLAEPITALGNLVAPYRLILCPSNILSQTFQIGAKIPFPIDIESCYEILLSKEWFDVIGALPPSEDVHIKISESEGELSIKCKDMNCSFKLGALNDPMTMWNDVEFGDIADLPNNFSEFLKKGSSIVLKEVGNFNFVHIANFGIEAVGDVRALRADVSGLNLSKDFVLDPKIAQCLGRYDLKTMKMAKESDLIEFETDGATIRVVPLSVQYPDNSWLWNKTLEVNYVDRSLPELEPVIKRACIFLDDHNKFVRITKTGSSVVVKCDSDFGSFHEEVLCEDTNLNFDILINPTLLFNEFDSCDKFALIPLRDSEEGSVAALVLKSKRGDVDQTYVVALAIG